MDIHVSSSLFLILRILFAWAVAILLAGIVWSVLFGGPQALFWLLAWGAMALALVGAVTHLRRVRLAAGRLDAAVLSNHQQRRIELPLDAGAAFDLIEAAVRELPRVEDIEASRGSLQVRAKVRRSDPFGGPQPSRWNLLARFAITRDRVRRAAQANGGLPARGGLGNARSAGQDEGQRPGPEGLDQLLGKHRDGLGVVGHGGAGALGVPLGIGHMHDQRVVGRAALGRKNVGHGAGVVRIGGQAVHGFGRQTDQLALGQRVRRAGNGVGVVAVQNHA